MKIGHFRWKNRGGTGSGTVTQPSQQQLFVSNGGSGTQNGLSAANAATFANIWTIAAAYLPSPGVTINAANGTYQGAANMIQPPAGFSGVAGNLVVIQATNDGQATIDGQATNIPIKGVKNSNYINIKGFNAKNSSRDVIELGYDDSSGGPNNWLVQRCVAWDAYEALSGGSQNTNVAAINYGINNTFEDCGFFGVGRKMFISFSNAGPNTYRRCWGRFEWSQVDIEHVCANINYRAYQTLFENCLFTWDTSQLPSYLVWKSADGTLITNPPGPTCWGTWNGDSPSHCSMTAGTVNQTHGIVSDAGFVTCYPSCSTISNCKMYGCIVYEKTGSTFQAISGSTQRLVDFSNGGAGASDAITLKDVCAIYPPGDAAWGSSKYRTMALGAGTAGTGLSMTNITSFKGTSLGLLVDAAWSQTNVKDVTQPSALYSGTGPDGINPESLWNTNQGASIRYRYVNGILQTGTALWPWPMNQRIIDAIASAAGDGHSHQSEDINSVMTGYFGAFI